MIRLQTKGSHLATVVFAWAGSLLLHIAVVVAIVVFSPRTYSRADRESSVIVLGIVPEYIYKEDRSITDNDDGADVRPPRPSRKTGNKGNVVHYRAQDNSMDQTSGEDRKPRESLRVQPYGMKDAHSSHTLHTSGKAHYRAISPHNMQEDGDDGYMAEYKNMVRTIIEQNVFYPVVARKRGYEGRVGLYFYIMRDGTISDLHISSPSNYRVLNRAAVRIVQKAAPFPPVRISQDRVMMEIEIVFKLR